MELNQDNLARITQQIPGPKYDRSQLKSGIVHIGIGGFHRSHQAYYCHKLLNLGSSLEWGICGLGLREGDRKLQESLEKQDFLYNLVTRFPDGKIETEVIGILTDFVLAVDSPTKAIERMANPETKIVSLTITEGGYNFNTATGEFNFNNPDIQHELANPDDPRTIYGYLTAALEKRKSENIPPFTILSCDNIQHNGNVTKKMVLTFAKRQNPQLASWISENVQFPNTMVDRITPVSTSSDRIFLEENYGIKDNCPVTCEPFIQWVVEDKFSNGRPLLELVGVQFVTDVTPYEKLKIRLLNAGHSVLGIPGAIHGHPTIDTCMNDPVFSTFMRKFMDLEVTPVLDKVEGIDLEKYKDSLEERFSNPNIKDSVSRICSESSAKLPKFIIPTLEENLAKGGSIRFASLILAAWCYYSDKQVNENGIALEIIDGKKKELHQAASDSTNNHLSFLELGEVFGDLKNNEKFVMEFSKQIKSIYQGAGIRNLMKNLIG